MPSAAREHLGNLLAGHVNGNKSVVKGQNIKQVAPVHRPAGQASAYAAGSVQGNGGIGSLCHALANEAPQERAVFAQMSVLENTVVRGGENNFLKAPCGVNLSYAVSHGLVGHDVRHVSVRFKGHVALFAVKGDHHEMLKIASSIGVHCPVVTVRGHGLVAVPVRHKIHVGHGGHIRPGDTAVPVAFGPGIAKVAQHDDHILRPVIRRKRLRQPVKNGFFGGFGGWLQVEVVVRQRLAQAGFHGIWRNNACDNDAHALWIFRRFIINDHRLCDHAGRIALLVREVFGHGVNLAGAVFTHQAQQLIAVVQWAFRQGVIKGVVARREHAVAHLPHKLCHTAALVYQGKSAAAEGVTRIQNKHRMALGPRTVGHCLEPGIADVLFFRIVSHVAMDIIGNKYFYIRQNGNGGANQQKK